MKIFAIIFMVLGVIGVIYCVPNGLTALEYKNQIPGSEDLAYGLFIVAGISFLAAVLGYNIYSYINNKSKMIEEISSKIQNLKARQKNTGENFNLKITNAKAMTGILECSVGVKINDEDKGRTAKGEENTYDLPEGAHKLQFYTTTLKSSVTSYLPTVVDFTKDTTLIVNFANSGNFGWKITN